MPNEILNIQHTITQLQNVEKVQVVGLLKEQYQQKQEAVHLQEKKVLEQTIVQISEEAEKVFLNEEKQNKDRGTGNGEQEKQKDEETELKMEGEEELERVVDIVV